LLARAFMIRVIVLMTLMPDARPGDVIAALAGDLALVPWARPWRPASARAAGDWRNALGPVPLEELRDLVLGSAWREHQGRGLFRRRDHREEAAAAGGGRWTGRCCGCRTRPRTGRSSAPWAPAMTPARTRACGALPLTCCSCRALFAMPHGPAGTDKAAAEQGLLDEAMERFSRPCSIRAGSG